MKQYTTRVLKSVAVLLIGFPILYIVLAATLFDIPIGACGGILLSPFYYIVTFCAVIAGYGLWEMRRWSWYVFLISQGLITYENAVFVFSYSESHHKAIAFFLALFLQGMMLYRVAKEIRVPYFFPRIRWWESDPRYRLSVPVSIQRKSGETWDAEILDLSTVGCFIKLRSDPLEGEPLTLKFRIFGQELECEGTVVWCAQSAVTHPKGIGVKFGLMARPQRRTLRMVHRKLKKISGFYRSYRYLVNQEDFLKKLEELENSDPSLRKRFQFRPARR